MMEIVVNDSNILIDMHTAGLLEYARLSNIRFHTVDFVIEELNSSPYKRPLINDLIKDGVLYVATTSAEDMPGVMSLHAEYSNSTNLSLVDCAVMLYAKKNRYRLLTGDRKLRNHAIDEGVVVSGIFWIVDRFVEEGIVSPSDMVAKLKVLMSVNKRLPKKIFEEKIEQLIAKV